MSEATGLGAANKEAAAQDLGTAEAVGAGADAAGTEAAGEDGTSAVLSAPSWVSLAAASSKGEAPVIAV